MRVISYIVILILLIVGITFAILNAGDVVVDYYVNKISLPLSLLIALTFVIGALCGLFVGLIMYWKAKCLAKKTKRELAIVKEEVINLRSFPLVGER